MKNKRITGSGLVEVVIVAAILATTALAVFGTIALLSKFHQRNMLAIKGELLAEEGIEALRLIKANGWSSLSSLANGQARYLSLGASSWATSTSPEIIDGAFWRVIRISQVNRDSSDNIATSGGSVDQNTLLIDSSVSWNWRGATSSVVYKAYITNI